MEEDKRLDRVESKIDKLQDDFSELKVDFRVHTELIKRHVAGDEKIITEIQPMLQQFKIERELKERRKEQLKSAGVIVGMVVGLFGIIYQIYSSF